MVGDVTDTPDTPDVKAGSMEISASGRRMALLPRTLEEAMKLAALLAESAIVPKDFRGKPGDTFVAMQYGMELGLSPIQAVQSIAIFNGRPAVWGDALLGIVMASGLLEDIDESDDGSAATCTVTRRGSRPVTQTFSMADAAAAKVSERDAQGNLRWVPLSDRAVWRSYPRRMRQMRARGFALRDAFADLLKGLQLAEEVKDYGPAPDARLTEDGAEDLMPRRKSQEAAALVAEQVGDGGGAVSRGEGEAMGRVPAGIAASPPATVPTASSVLVLPVCPSGGHAWTGTGGIHLADERCHCGARAWKDSGYALFNVTTSQMTTSQEAIPEAARGAGNEAMGAQAGEQRFVPAVAPSVPEAVASPGAARLFLAAAIAKEQAFLAAEDSAMRQRDGLLKTFEQACLVRAIGAKQIAAWWAEHAPGMGPDTCSIDQATALVKEAEALPIRTAVTINGKKYMTLGITAEQLLETFTLSAAVDHKTGHGTAAELLAKEFGLKTRVDLTQERGERYLIRLREIAEL